MVEQGLQGKVVATSVKKKDGKTLNRNIKYNDSVTTNATFNDYLNCVIKMSDFVF